MNLAYTIEATVESIKTNTEGWGDKQRVVGYAVDAKYELEEAGDGTKIMRTVNVIFPGEFRTEISPGDRMTILFADTSDA